MEFTALNTNRRHLVLLTLLFLVVGSVLRMIWPGDMIWQYDEIWMYEHSQAVAHGAAPWPGVGIMSHAGYHNPGLSEWVFIALAKVAHDPIGMVIGVQFLNVLTLWLLFLFVQRNVPPDRQNLWLWGILLVSVSPMPILFSRKLWAQCILPPFCLILLWSHWHRTKKWGAFAWGLSGGLIGQIHLSGFFLAFAILAWTALKTSWRKVPWRYWLGGSSFAALLLIPWLPELLLHRSQGKTRILDLNFYCEWVMNSLGTGLRYVFRDGFADFLRGPLIDGTPSYLMAIAHLFLLGCGLVWLARVTWKPYRIADRPLRNEAPELGFYVGAAFIVMGLLISFSVSYCFPHYMIVVFPFLQCSLVLGLVRFPRLLTAIALTQLFISIDYLTFIHIHGGAPFYGVAYHLLHYSPH